MALDSGHRFFACIELIKFACIVHKFAFRWPKVVPLPIYGETHGILMIIIVVIYMFFKFIRPRPISVILTSPAIWRC